MKHDTSFYEKFNMYRSHYSFLVMSYVDNPNDCDFTTNDEHQLLKRKNVSLHLTTIMTDKQRNCQ